MSELDVTAILEADCYHMSNSVANLGPDAGKVTWANCVAFAEDHPLVTDANRDDIRDHFAEYGAWEREEIDTWGDTELSAMVWQEVASDARHFFEHCGGYLRKYRTDCENGTISGRLNIGRVTSKGQRKAWFYVGI